MKLILGTSLLFVFLLLSSCSSSYKMINFEKMRTPLNPIAHKGVNEYTPIAHLEYAQQALLEEEYYNREVEKRKEDYKQALERYNNATVIERITRGLVPPELILPVAPILPYMINKSQVEAMVKIDGMQKSQGNGLLVNVYFEGFKYTEVQVKDSIKKTVKEGVQYIDTVYSSSAKVRHPLRLKVVAPNGESFSNQIDISREFKLLRTQNFASRYAAENKIYELIQKEEQNLHVKSIEEINRILNDQFGTKLVSYSANIFQVKSDKYDYSDLDEASLLAQKGFKLLQPDPNKAYEHLNQAYGIWKSALNEHQSDKKARINDKVKQGILINLLTTAIYTDNWTDALEYTILLDNMKLGAQASEEFKRLKTIQNDLKKRHDATKN